MKRVLITGQNSYIGNETELYLRNRYPGQYDITKISLRTEDWKKLSFAGYDAIVHVAGIAHVDISHATEEVKANYYRVNTDLTEAVSQKAKAEGAGCFIYLSSMIVYGDCAPAGKKKVITAGTKPKASNFYGDSKLKAEQKLRAMADENYKVILLRPPFVYGKGSKGNYASLARLAEMLPVFPKVDNERSMIYIGNLCEVIRRCIDWEIYVKKKEQNCIVCCPQNDRIVSTSELVREIAINHGKNIRLFGGLDWLIELCAKLPGKYGKLFEKAFGSMIYAPEFSVSMIDGYQKYTWKESIRRTEK